MNFYTRRRPKPVLQIISMIDLLIVLLLFLVVSTSFKDATSHLQLSLPQTSSGTGNAEASARLSLTVTKDNKILLGAKEIALEQLAASVTEAKTARPDVKLDLKIDKSVPTGMTLQIYDALKQAGCKMSEVPLRVAKP
jgi:biopolymer transport protein ExbD